MFTDEETTLFQYNGLDTIITAECWNGFKDEISSFGFEEPYEQTLNVLEPLMAMMARGIKVDAEQLAETKNELTEKRKSKGEELKEEVGFDLNPNSPKQCIEYFYGTLKCTPYKNQSGNPTVDDKALTRMARGTAARPPIKAAKIIQELRALDKLMGTYINIEFDPDGRFRCSYNPRGTKFGRLSSSKTPYDTGMNAQNLPQEFKKFLIPDTGYLMWEIDKAGAEWVVVAYSSGDPEMLRVVEEGIDPHIHTAALMTGLDKEVIALEDKYVKHLTDPDEIGRIRNELRKDSAVARELDRAKFLPRSMGIRQAGKKANHGLNYGEGHRMFAMMNEIPEKEAKIIVDKYSGEVYTSIPLWWEKVQNQLRQDRTLVNCFGRKCRFLGEWGNDLFKAAYSFEPQSTVVDIINRGLVKAYKDTEGVMAIQELLGQVHDSALGQTPLRASFEDEADETSEYEGIAWALIRIAEYMNPELEISGRSFKIGNELKVGTSNWADLTEVEYTTNVEQLAERIRGETRTD